MYKYIFGPVPSRRLGMSLGVDLVPKKVCSLDCVYCEVGKTTCHTNERKEYIPSSVIIEELKDYLSNNPDPDFFTFSGYGEPTLNAGIGKIVKFIKEVRPNIPIALLTNGTLLTSENLRKEILEIDVVLPSLDAVSQKVFENINRPESSINIDQCIEGLLQFRKEFKNKLWLEVFILPGYNDDIEELSEFKRVIGLISPDSVQLNTLDRPGTVDGLRPATRVELQSIIDLWEIDNAQIISASANRKEQLAFRTDVQTAIHETISRRPCTLDDMSKMTGLHVNEINKYLDVLDKEGKIEAVRGERGLFYQLKEKLHN